MTTAACAALFRRVFVHCLGPNPTCPATRMAQARGLLSGYTNRGICFPLTCAWTVNHRAKKIATSKARPSTRDQLFGEPECRSRRPSQSKEQDTDKGKTSL